MTSWAEPTSQEIEKAVGKLTRPELVTYFFRHLKNPLWLRPLEERGFFRSPPALQKTPEGTLSPPWPPADYLVQIASEQPEHVARIIAGIKTENWGVQLTLADASLKLPASVASKVALHLGNWMKAHYRHPLLHDRLADLVSHLATGGEAQVALKLAKKLLAVLPAPPTEDYLFSSPRGLIDDWEYRELLEKLAVPLRAAAGEEYTSLLYALLGAAVKHGIRAHREPGDDPEEDWSMWWRPAIENHVQNGTGDVRDALIEALRDDLLARVTVQPSAIEEVWQRLLKRRYSIFHRIGLHLLASIPEPPTALVHEAVFDRGWFDNPKVHHEYYQLLERHFSLLHAADRDNYLTLVANRAKEKAGTEGAEWWEYRQLSPLQYHLVGNWKTRLDLLRTKLGDLEHPDFLSYMTTGSGWELKSPRSADELSKLPTEELLSFLREWSPGLPGRFEPSIQGLASQVALLVQRDPERFVSAAAHFVSLPLPYQQALLNGLDRASAAGVTWDWEPILEFGAGLISVAGSSEDSRCLLLSLARLLSPGLTKGEAEIPITLRQQAWALISALTGYPDPSQDVDGTDKQTEPMNDSLNTVRGRAMHAAISYGLWVRRSQEVDESRRKSIQRGFDEMPELRALLERHLDLNQDRSPAVRAVYGQWLPWLHLLDAAWTQRHIDDILPPGAEQEAVWRATWESYVTLAPPYTAMLELLRDNYRIAIEKLAALPRAKRERERDATTRLSEHLASFLWRGEEPLENERSLIVLFYKHAPPWLSAHFVEYIGRSLRNTLDVLPEAVQNRLMRFWDWRLESLTSRTTEDGDQHELEAFMWWVNSAKLPQQWTANALVVVSRLMLAPGHDVTFALKQIAELASQYPHEIATTVENLITKDKEIWHTTAWAEDITDILRRLSSTAISEVDQTVRRIADALGRKGFLQFREFARV